MKRETLVFPFEIKSLEENEKNGVIEGYASVFNVKDSYKDIVKKGAFKKTIKEKKGKFPILNNHNPYDQIGWNEEANEDDHGLFVKGRINLEVQSGREQWALAKQAKEIGAKTGLSIGYVPIKIQWDKEDNEIRYLTEIQLWEYSMVVWPANPDSNLTNVKSIDDSITDLITNLENRGHKRENIVSALNTRAATTQVDPDKLIQSYERTIELLKS